MNRNSPATQDKTNVIQNNDVFPEPGLCNHVVVFGRLLEDAEFFPTKSGKPKVSFRIAIPRSPDLPRKKPASGDFYTVVCYGERFVRLLDLLTEDRQVVVFGWAQSRDVDTADGPRTVNEIGARTVIPVLDPALLPVLDGLVGTVLNLKGLDLKAFREALMNGDGFPELPEEVRNVLAPNGQLHPDIRQAILRVLSQGEEE